MIRTLIVDDEQPARERLRRLLHAFEDLEVVDEAEDGEEAIEKIVRLAPDLVLLDIQMPGCSGMEVAASLPSPRPRIIFCTAFDEYAVDAFEVHAVDYLLKPVNRTRLAQALDRVRSAGDDDQDASIDRADGGTGGHPVRFLAKRGSRYYVIPKREVQCFVFEGGQTKLQVADRHYWMQPTLSDLERRLDSASFFRVSRAAIVNLDAVSQVLPLPGGHGEVELHDGRRLEVSRRRFKDLMDRLSDASGLQHPKRYRLSGPRS